MKTYKDIINAFREDDFSRETMEEFSAITSELMDDYKEHHPKEYEKYLKRMNEVIFPKKTLDEHKAKKYVEKLKHEKNINQMFTMTQVEKMMKDDEHLKDMDPCLIYYTLNLVYYIFYDPNFSTKSYIKLAHKLLNHNLFNEDIIEAVHDMLEE